MMKAIEEIGLKRFRSAQIDSDCPNPWQLKIIEVCLKAGF